MLDEIKAILARLPAPERAELAHYLLHTLEPAEEGAAAEWLALAEERMAEVRAGRVVGIPAEQVLESLRGRGNEAVDFHPGAAEGDLLCAAGGSLRWH
jgi:putative addiction module component (TIGR02574 family)